MGQYPTKVTDKQWQIRKIFSRRHHERYHVFGKTGCQWHMLPKDFPPYDTVFYYFDRWKWEGVFEELMETLHIEVRRLAGREDSPSLGIIDSRSVKSSHHVDATAELTVTRR